MRDARIKAGGVVVTEEVPFFVFYLIEQGPQVRAGTRPRRSRRSSNDRPWTRAAASLGARAPACDHTEDTRLGSMGKLAAMRRPCTHPSPNSNL